VKKFLLPTPSSTALKAQGALYLCALASLCLALYAVLTRFGVIEADIFGKLPMSMLGAGLLVLPGYSLCRALGLDRHGTAILGMLSFAFSLALLALAGASAWLILGELDVLAIETFVLAITITLCATSSIRGTPASSKSRQAQPPASAGPPWA
jgi:hypothetical protein